MTVESLHSDPMAGCTRDTIKVQTVDGIQQLTCWRRGALAIHPRLWRSGQSITQWSITHVPSGICFNWVFPGMDEAAAAMTRLAEVTDWASFDVAQATPQFRAAVAQALAPHGERASSDEPSHEERMRLAKDKFRRDLNPEGES